jgi:hypothetical protein
MMTREELRILHAATEILHALERQIHAKVRHGLKVRDGLTVARLSSVVTQLHMIITTLEMNEDQPDEPTPS